MTGLVNTSMVTSRVGLVCRRHDTACVTATTLEHGISGVVRYAGMKTGAVVTSAPNLRLGEATWDTATFKADVRTTSKWSHKND